MIAHMKLAVVCSTILHIRVLLLANTNCSRKWLVERYLALIVKNEWKLDGLVTVSAAILRFSLHVNEKCGDSPF